MAKELSHYRAQQAERGFFGRRLGRPLNKTRQALIDDLLPTLSIVIPDQRAPQSKPALQAAGMTRDINPSALFPPDTQDVWMEIGFGDGAHLQALMKTYSAHGFIGVEPYINGMGNFLNRIKEMSHERIRVYMEDAIPLVKRMADSSIGRLYILNPDPWPKTRHHKRRIINQANLDEFARILKPGGLLILATDVDDLAEWVVTHCALHPAFRWTARGASDWKHPPSNWLLQTRFASKGVEAGRRQVYLLFERAFEREVLPVCLNP